MTAAGSLALWIAVLMSAWSVLTTIAGARGHRDDLLASGRRATYAVSVFAGAGCIAFCGALLSTDLSLRAVASYTSGNLPRLYRLGALWVSPAGTLVFWSGALALWAAIATAVRYSGVRANDAHKQNARMHAVLAAVTLCVISIGAVAANPFERLALTPLDGRGLHPMYQHPAMPIHEMLLHAGLTMTSVPFAMALAFGSSTLGHRERTSASSQWTTCAWMLLTLGLVVGLRWTYAQVESARVWMWDPAQTGALAVWLVMTARMMTLPVERATGALRRWNALLAGCAFPLAISAAFVTRSGVVTSAQEFAGAVPIRSIAALVVLLIIAAVWSAARMNDNPIPRGRRFVAHVAVSVALAAIALSSIWGTAYPAFTAWFSDILLVVSPAFYDFVNVPLGITALTLAGVALSVGTRRLAWSTVMRRCAWPLVAGVAVAVAFIGMGMRAVGPLMCVAVAAFAVAVAVRHVVRHAWRAGPALALAGVGVLCAGVSGNALREEHRVTLAPGERVALQDPWHRTWTFTSQGVSFSEEANRRAQLVALRAERGAQFVAIVRTELRQHFNTVGDETFAASLVPGILPTLTEDVYVAFDHATAGGTAMLRVAFNPLMMLVWIGGAMMTAGGLVLLVTHGSRRA